MAKKSNEGGRIPLSEKDALDSSDFSHEDLDYNLLKLDPELVKELKGKGLAYRWINAKKFQAGGNFHQSGWRPYKREQDKPVGAMDFSYGVSPEGYIQRHDLLLAVKTQSEYSRWQAKIKRRADIMSGVNRNRADELRQAAKEAGVKMKITEGYEENE